MSCIGFLVNLRKSSVYVETRDNKLLVKAAQGSLTAENKVKLGEKKQDILTLYQALGITSNTQLAQVSFAQQRLWFLDVLEKGGSHHNMPQQLRFQGNLDLTALEKTIKTIVQRHQILRSTYVSEEGEPFQVIHPHNEAKLEIIDLRELPPHEINSKAQQLITEEVEKPFDLSKDLMLRTKLVRLAEEDNLLLYTMHHIASDGWSQGIFINEFNMLYEAYENGIANPLADLNIQYADYAHWQRNWLQGEVLEEKLNYWKDKLQGIPLVHNLPLDRPRPRQQTFNGGQYHSSISGASLKNFKNLVREQNCTLFMGLHSLLALLVSRLSGDKDIVIGTPIANREQMDISPLIGFFINVLVLRSELNKVESFTQLLRQSKEVCLGAYAHQQVPFEELLKVLNLGKSLSVSPMFQIMLVLQNNDVGELNVSGLKFQQRESEVSQAKFDLSVSAVEMKDSLYITWSYNSDLFDRSSVELMASCFEKLLCSVLENPDGAIRSLALMESLFQQDIHSDKRIDVLPAVCIHHLFEQQAEQNPEAVALRSRSSSLNYHQINQQANQLAHLLIAKGVEPDQPVAFYLPRSERMIITVLAILKAGGCYVAIDDIYPSQRVAELCEEVKARILITEKRPHDGALLASLDIVEWEDAQFQQRLGFCPNNNPKHHSTEHNLAYMCFTSGSTGKPKAVMVSHQNVYSYYDSVREHYQLQAQDNILQFSSVSFDIFVEEMFCALCSGASLVLRDQKMLGGGHAFWQFLEDFQITVLSLPTAYWHSLCASMSESEIQDTNALRLLILGGESMSAAMLKRWQTGTCGNTKVFNTYGPTETTVISCYYDATHFDTSKGSIPIGGPIKNVRCYVLDDNLQLCPPRVFGQLYVGGPSVSRGYCGHSDLTANAFISAPHLGEKNVLYRTGDLVRYMPNGELEFKGRIDGQVKIRGFRVELEEIEQQLNKSVLVDSCLVIAKNGSTGNKFLTAYIQADKSHAVAREEAEFIRQLSDSAKRSLPDYMVPSAFVVVDAWPLTSQGKVDKQALPEPSFTWLQGEYQAPESETEKQLVEIWEKLLSIPSQSISVGANFFDLGGHSLLCVRLVAEVQHHLGVEMDVKAIFEEPSLTMMAAYIDKLSDPEFVGEMKNTTYENNVLQRFGSHDSSLPTIYFIPGVAGSAFMFNDFAKYGLQRFNVQAFNHRGVFDEEEAFDSIEDNAIYFYQQIIQRQKVGPYLVAGHSYGGALAYEVVGLIEAAGHEVQLILLDTYFEQQSLVLENNMDGLPNGEEVVWQQGLALDPSQQSFKQKLITLAEKQTHMFYDYKPKRSDSLQPMVILAKASPFNLDAYQKKLSATFPRGLKFYNLEEDHFSMLKGSGCQKLCTLLDESLLQSEPL